MKKGMNSLPILLVEDDSDDIEITQRALKKSNIYNPLYIVRDGEEALCFLKNEGEYVKPETAPRPGIILLDLNMPRMDGRELLQKIKSIPELCSIPTIVLTTSKYEEDVIRCYDYGASSYISKPVNFKEFTEILKVIGTYWLTIVELPE